MKSNFRIAVLSFTLGCAVKALAAFGPIPDGDFESPAGDAGAWVPANGEGTFVYNYPADGGNPGGYGVIDHVAGGGFGIWVGNNGAAIPLSSLGLEAGKTYTFLQDMKILSGTKIGGFKVDFFNGGAANGTTGEMYPAAGGSAEWATYSFSVTIRAGTDGIKIVPLWGPNSSVGYDNIRIKEPEPLAAVIKAGTLLQWTGVNGSTYQPQESADGVGWMDVGPLIAGAAVQSRLDETPAAFYQVVEVTPGGAANVVGNPGFESAGGNSLGSSDWSIVVQPNTGASMSIVDSFGAILPHGGEQFLKFESTTAASGAVAAPNTDVRSSFIEVTPGTVYDLSFYAANPVKTGGANPQYSLFFYNAANGAVGGPIFTSFSGVGASWTKVTRSVTPPAGATKMTIGWIQAMGAGNGWRWVTLIDDVSLTTGLSVPDITTLIPFTIGSGFEVTWNSLTGTDYQFQSSIDCGDWQNLGNPVAGTGDFMSARAFREGPEMFYRAKVVP